MELHRYDVVEVKLNYGKGSTQSGKRPALIVSNEIGNIHSQIITILPITSSIKKENMPTHGCINAETGNGLNRYSMILGEQPQTISKDDVIKKFGNVHNDEQRKMINKVCYNSFFFGENIEWEEILA